MKQRLNDLHDRAVRCAMIVLMAVGGLVLGGGSIVGCKTVVYPEKPDERPEIRRRADREQRDLEKRTNDDDEKLLNFKH